MTDTPTSPRSVPSQMGALMQRRGDEIVSWVQVSPELCAHGIVRAACLVMLVDVGAGYLAELESDDDWSFTVDIGVRRTPVATDRIDGRPAVQRAGRTISVDVPMHDDHDRVSASGVATFIRLPRRPQDPPRPNFPIDAMDLWHPPEAPLEDLLGAHPTTQGLAVDLRPELLNPAGILQGGAAALLAELAAQATLERDGARLAVTSFDVRYVTMGRVGPIEAVVEPIGSRLAVVRLIDRGADDALVTHNLLGFEAI